MKVGSATYHGQMNRRESHWYEDFSWHIIRTGLSCVPGRLVHKGALSTRLHNFSIRSLLRRLDTRVKPCSSNASSWTGPESQLQPAWLVASFLEKEFAPFQVLFFVFRGSFLHVICLILFTGSLRTALKMWHVQQSWLSRQYSFQTYLNSDPTVVF